ncbi:GNAT family N-acetyltransferase [Ornithinicoccus halotolerans]|uniref:GNAT family N-acetyltransferase n=1 Tax=Ornithinicoccus halotolerans TaxID=1748220 RepID=UPI001295906F|nr:GNAT family N-acetyltransferase [Ornithinicoccus halotolerans]
MTSPADPAPSPAHLPAGWSARPPAEPDVPALTRLLRAHERAARGRAGAHEHQVAATVTGPGAARRQQVVVEDADGVLRAWTSSHDRAAGRVLVAVTVDPDLAEEAADPVAAWCFERAARDGAWLAAARGLERTQLDSGAFAGDSRQQRWLGRAGYRHVRNWWQMSRPVTPAEGSPPEPDAGVEVRRVRREEAAGMPEESDLRAVHHVLEASFTDHFNSHREDFEEFLTRLREDPGHRWDHWWLALVDGEPAGALVASTVAGHGADDAGRARPDGSYVDYLGVLASARGRGVARTLLGTVIADAAARGRDRVDLEVDADSPTGAHDLYRSLGWRTGYTTQSWHCELPVGSG